MITVKIIKANSPKRWYADKIGHIIEVKKKYPGAWILENGSGIDIDDAVEVETMDLFNQSTNGT